MRGNNCLTKEMLKVGMTFEKELFFSKDDVDTYCSLSGDRNSIHSNLDAARRRFPGIKDVVVPGGLLQIAIAGLFGSDFPGDGSLGLTFEPERVRRPICPGDSVRIVLEVTKIRGQLAEFEIMIRNSEGEQISGAKSRVMLPDQDWRAWWEKQS